MQCICTWMNLSRVLLFDTASVVNQMDYQNLPLPYKRGRLKEEGEYM